MLSRRDAIGLLVQEDLAQLAPEERPDLLLDWWSIGPEDPEYDALPDTVRAAIERDSEPGDPFSPEYDRLLEIGLRRAYVGVTNCYLERRLASIGRTSRVEGGIEELETCPCCRYRSLSERGAYEICRVCFWEDDGTTDPEKLSAANRMTLHEARRNFERLGAVSEASQSHVLPDGKERYAKQSV